MVAQWLALLLHSVLDSNSSCPRSFLCGVCMFSLCLRGFPRRINTPVNAPDQGTRKKNWSWSLGAVLLLPPAPSVCVENGSNSEDQPPHGDQ